MKVLLLIFLVLTTNNEPLFVQGKSYSGYIFDQEHPVFLSIENQNKRFSPTKSDVDLAEQILTEKIKSINSNLINQSDACPIIHKNLKRYVRQYVGFINTDGQKIIWINFIWETNTSKNKLQKDIVQTLDGCSYYWNAKVNINEKILFDLTVNGNG